MVLEYDNESLYYIKWTWTFLLVIYGHTECCSFSQGFITWNYNGHMLNRKEITLSVGSITMLFIWNKIWFLTCPQDVPVGARIMLAVNLVSPANNGMPREGYPLSLAIPLYSWGNKIIKMSCKFQPLCFKWLFDWLEKCLISDRKSGSTNSVV